MTKKLFTIYTVMMVIGIALEVIATTIWIETCQDSLSNLIMAIVFGLITGGSIFTVVCGIIEHKRNNR